MEKPALLRLLFVALAGFGASGSAGTTQQPWAALFSANRCEFARALDLLEADKLSTMTPWDVGILKARLLLQLERGSDAEATLKALPSANTAKQKADLQFLSGMASALKKDLPSALAAFAEARKAGFDKNLVEGGIGMAYLKAGNLPQAERALINVLKRDPTLTGALYNLACLRTREGRIAEAAALIRQAWHLGLKDPARLARDPELGALRGPAGLIQDLILANESSCGAF